VIKEYLDETLQNLVKEMKMPWKEALRKTQEGAWNVVFSGI
jgi:hypothetical protein